ncbi:CRISPR-associated protein [Escherichia coli]|uniref:CRISPR-associated protein n=1 Tax=Escherichia coli TaxID=562 RepID=A0A447X2T0_ECOLX|nr:CRISPR-associated protein [Escherichia coli]
MRLVSVKRLSKMIFFTAVDDLRQASEDAGAGHLGETGFGSALFYTYICIDKDLLVENLGGDEALANQTLRAFTEAAFKVSPTGKQNSFASRAYASWGDGRKRYRTTALSGGGFL